VISGEGGRDDDDDAIKYIKLSASPQHDIKSMACKKQRGRPHMTSAIFEITEGEQEGRVVPSGTS
jgi:hypothetical protein